MHQPEYRHVALAAALLLFVAGGCRTDNPSVDEDADGGADAGTDAATAATAAGIRVEFDPSLFLYRPDSTVKGVATVLSEDGDARSDVDVSWSAEPSDAAEKVGSSTFKFKKEGTVTIRACATLDGGRKIYGSKDATVDAGPPAIQLDKPKAGAMIEGETSADKPTITVAGKITDSHGETVAFLNGEELALEDDGSFSTTVPATFGVNEVRIAASDGLNQEMPSKTRQVVWAQGYESVDTSGSTLEVKAPVGLGFNVGQNFFDDTKPPERKTSESKLVARDVADVLNLLVSNIDLASLLSNPLVDNSSATLNVDSVQLGKPTVVTDITDDGLTGYLHIDQLVVKTSGKVTIERQTLSLNGSIAGRASAFVDISINQKSSGEFTTNVETLEVSIDQAKPSFADKKANAIFQLAEGTLRKRFEKQFRKVLRNQLIGALPGLLDKQLNSLQSTLASQSFSFGTELTGQRTASFSGDIENFRKVFRTSISGTSNTTIGVEGMDQHPSSLGTPVLAPGVTTIPWFEQSRLQVGFRLKVINGMLTGLWKSGFLDINLADVLPDRFKNVLEKADMRTKIPPVVRPARDDEPYDLVLEAGQIELDTKAIKKDDRYGIRIRAGLNVKLENNELVLTAPDTPDVHAWTIEQSKDMPFIPPDQLEGIVLKRLWPPIKKSLKNGLAIPLPAPSLSGLSGISPTLSNMKLNYELATPPAARDGFIVLDAGFRGELPLGN